MSPAIVKYVNLPRRVEPAGDVAVMAGRGGTHPPLTINIPACRPLRLTGHLASGRFQGMVTKLLGNTFPGDPPVRPEEEVGAGEEEGDGDGEGNGNGAGLPQPGSVNTQSGVPEPQGDVNSGRRRLGHYSRNAVQNAKRLAARQEYQTNPGMAQARRSARLAHKEFINYNDDDYFVGVRDIFNR
jgi:hypothetical protein